MARDDHPEHRPQGSATSLEREVTLAVADEVALPDLVGVAGTSRGGAQVHMLHATYHDTPTWALLRRGLTLRHRTGGDDAGWHLKVPVDGTAGDGDLAVEDDAGSPLVSRAEHHAPAGARARTVPRGLRRLVAALVLDEPLGPVAVLDTHRVSVPLVDDAGRTWATLTDDTVTAHRERARHGDDPEVVRWREWEVELAGGPAQPADADRLTAVVAALRAAGARTSPTTSKLRRALGDVPLPSPWTGRPRSAHELAALRVGVLVERLREEDLRWRTGAGDPPSVHRMRTTARRLRSVLQTYGVALDPGRDGDPDGPVARVRGELRWLGGELGHHRDAEVLGRRLREQLDGLGASAPADGRRAVARLLDDVLAEPLAAGARRVDRALASARYRALLAALDELAVPPRPDGVDAAAVRREVGRLVRRDVRRLRRAVRRAGVAGTGPERDAALHEARKTAKRLRYAADTARPVLGRGAARLARAAAAVQEPLGDHQDAVVAHDALRALTAVVARRLDDDGPVRAAAAVPVGVVVGLLLAAQDDAARRAEAAYDVARDRLPRHPRRLLRG